MDVAKGSKQVKKVPKSQGYNNKLNESQAEKSELIFDDQPAISEEEQVLNAFKFFDVNNRGYLSCREYFSILLSTRQFTEEEIEKIIKSSNLNINGNLDYKQFYQFWKRK